MMTDTPRRKPDGAALALANTIFEIGRLAQRSTNLNEVIRSIDKRIIDEIRADFAGIALVDDQRNQVVHTWGSLADGGEIGGDHSQKLGEGVVGTAAASRGIVRIDDIQAASNYVEMVPGMRSEVAVPLILGDRVIGVLDAESRRPNAFGEQEMALLQAVANPIAQAIELARLLQENRRRQERLELLNELARVAATTRNLDKLLPRVTRTIRERQGIPFVAIGLLTDDHEIELAALSADREVSIAVGHTQAAGVGIVGQVLDSGETLLVGDVHAHANLIVTHPDFRCELCCPMRMGDRIIGFLDVEHESTDAFDPADRLLYETIAEQLGQVVDNANKVRHIERLRDELSGMFVHDLRNPLSVVQSTLDMLGRDIGRTAPARPARPDTPPPSPDKPPRYRRWLRAAQGSVNEMLVMIDGLLQLQRLESRALEVNRHACDLPALLESVVEQLQVIASPMAVEVEARIADTLPSANLDDNLVQRILQNLGMNAVKFTGADGRVTLSADAAPSTLVRERLDSELPCLLLSVGDTGPGIPESEHQRIFDKFAVLESRRAGHKFSTGLGLAFCRRAAEAHAGVIWVESSLGEGSTFHVLLPTDDA